MVFSIPGAEVGVIVAVGLAVEVVVGSSVSTLV